MQQVPWAEGRRALVLDVAHTGRWMECVGVLDDDGACWEAAGLDDDGDAQGEWYISTFRPTNILPGQCSHCFEVNAHSGGCPVAANIARGVPAWMAPFVREEAPVYREADSLFTVSRDGFLIPGCWTERDGEAATWVTRGGHVVLGWLALGPDGPTLEPWGGEG